jgi:hypothetical protein
MAGPSLVVFVSPVRASMTKRFRERENGYPEVEIIRPLTMKDANQRRNSAVAAQQM